MAEEEQRQKKLKMERIMKLRNKRADEDFDVEVPISGSSS